MEFSLPGRSRLSTNTWITNFNPDITWIFLYYFSKVLKVCYFITFFKMFSLANNTSVAVQTAYNTSDFDWKSTRYIYGLNVLTQQSTFITCYFNSERDRRRALNNGLKSTKKSMNGPKNDKSYKRDCNYHYVYQVKKCPNWGSSLYMYSDKKHDYNIGQRQSLTKVSGLHVG
jgi:hypothetical protein